MSLSYSISKIWHARTDGSSRFGYRCPFVRLNIRDVGSNLLFGWNQPALFSVYEKDYLGWQSDSLYERLCDFLKPYAKDYKVQNVELITTPRFLGYAFNPVSFFLCYDEEAKLRHIVADVNNTFREKHIYVLENTSKESSFQAKQFHVSPFFDLEGEYNFKWKVDCSKVNMHINLIKNGEPALITNIVADFQQLDLRAFLLRIHLWSFIIWMTMPRILMHAAKLYFLKGKKVYTKPVPSSKQTLRSSPDRWIDRIAFSLITKLFKKIKVGRLDIQLPDERLLSFGQDSPSLEAKIVVRDYSFFTKLLMHSDIGLGESFESQDWTSPQPKNVIRLLIKNRKHLSSTSLVLAWPRRIASIILHWMHSNSLRGSKKNIAAHYDLGNDFFRTFLDPSMSYSSGVYSRPNLDLETAQREKIQMIIDKAQIQPGQEVLEIGCGWGEMAIQIAKQTGAKVTGLSLSKKQLEYAHQRLREEGLEDQIKLLYRDYREVQGGFDRIISIEMLEAVGHEHFDQYFKSVERLLKPNGIAVIQVITIPDQRYNQYRRRTDWIQRYIFPGGLLPSLTRLSQTMTRSSELHIHDLENIGMDYAHTLNDWSERFQRKKKVVLDLGYPEALYYRWLYYFAYCEAGFKERVINNLQLVLTRENNTSLRQKTYETKDNVAA